MDKELVDALTIIRDAWFGGAIDRPSGGRFRPLARAFDLLNTRLRVGGGRFVPTNDPVNSPKGNLRV